MTDIIKKENDKKNSKFTESEIYIDKTELISILNSNIGKSRRYFAVSRARRFGKSMVAGMLDAYYSMGCDSKEMFAPYKISKASDFDEHLNKYHVLHFDMATFLNEANIYRVNSEEYDFGDDREKTVRTRCNPVSLLNSTILSEFCKMYPEIVDDSVETVPKAIEKVWSVGGHQFVIIIDEWDCVIRDAKDDKKLITDYLQYLRGFFKTEESKRFLALGYITGILPIKKIEGESAMNNFREYTMIEPGELAPFFGFTEGEILGFTKEMGIPIEAIREWYDGYKMEMPYEYENPIYLHMYNPNSIVEVLASKKCISYWKNTGAFRQLNDYICMDKDGLKNDVIKMLAGESVPVDISTYQNDLTSFSSKDDVMTALIHMGYLGYDSEKGNAFIPNREVREIFESAIKVGEWNDISDALRKSDALLETT